MPSHSEEPPSSTDSQFLSPPPEATTTTSRRTGDKLASVYDAVAGRISTSLRFIHHPQSLPSVADSSIPIPPQHLLFYRQEGGLKKIRLNNSKSDIHQHRNTFENEYFAPYVRRQERMEQEGRRELSLPDSDMLKALHKYVSDFYGALEGGRQEGAREYGMEKGGDWRSLDETALLGMGVLLEEACREVMGEGGDLVFVEGHEVSDEEDEVTSVEESQRGTSAGWQDHNSRQSKRRRLESGQA